MSRLANHLFTLLFVFFCFSFLERRRIIIYRRHYNLLLSCFTAPSSLMTSQKLDSSSSTKINSARLPLILRRGAGWKCEILAWISCIWVVLILKCSKVNEIWNNKMLNYRREIALQGGLWPKVEDWNWKTIFHGHYRSIFNHLIGLRSYRTP